jgi:hypothetical protein
LASKAQAIVIAAILDDDGLVLPGKGKVAGKNIFVQISWEFRKSTALLGRQDRSWHKEAGISEGMKALILRNPGHHGLRRVPVDEERHSRFQSSASAGD